MSARLKRRMEIVELVELFLKRHGISSMTEIYRNLKADRNIAYHTMYHAILSRPDNFIFLKIEWGSGKLKASHFIKPNFLGKTFLALRKDRTSIVRFFMQIFRERNYYQGDVVAISRWLRRFGLSRAEKVAVITNLGYRYSGLRRIRINGWLNHKPQKI